MDSSARFLMYLFLNLLGLCLFIPLYTRLKILALGLLRFLLLLPLLLLPPGLGGVLPLNVVLLGTADLLLVGDGEFLRVII